ncbi:hypothetical protein CHH58_05130 [Terribacillus saccharophilus]|uniref:cell wall-binding protein n=1 Tax=Terribacillus saccharophilus TaxID=361277 RepID=UPI000BA51A37|nr:cell wall-binding protein [Terribacillus saccharophilus]PAF38808.1 hypothetical protein CHH58_05130 [Terribacillus saccharophilus]
MKKFKSTLAVLITVLAVSFFISPANSEAATSSWQSVSSAGSGCKVRIWNDASTYTKRATTVDFTIEQNGKCGKLDYTAGVKPRQLTSYSVPYVSGYFSNKTPVKKLTLNVGIWKKQDRNAYVGANLSKNGKDVGYVESNTFTIKKQ